MAVVHPSNKNKKVESSSYKMFLKVPVWSEGKITINEMYVGTLKTGRLL